MKPACDGGRRRRGRERRDEENEGLREGSTHEGRACGFRSGAGGHRHQGRLCEEGVRPLSVMYVMLD